MSYYEHHKDEIKYKACIRYWKSKGLSEAEAAQKYESALEEKLVKAEIRRMKRKESSREYYRRKQMEAGKIVAIRV